MPGTNRVTEKRLRRQRGAQLSDCHGPWTAIQTAHPPHSLLQNNATVSVPDSPREVALWLFMSVSSRSRGNRPTFDTLFKWPHQQTDNQWDKEEERPCQLGEGGVVEGVHRVKGGVYINGGRRAFTIPRSTSALITSCLQPTEPAAMAFNGTWKVDRSENYDKFMEQMGECGSHWSCRASALFLAPCPGPVI